MTYRDGVAEALDSGWRFGALYATAGGIVRTLLVSAGGEVRLESAERATPSIVDLAPAAGWDEREAHDLYGVDFAGHEPMRPLVDHDLDLGRWTVPIQGRDAYQVAVGPIHAGVIESGHFRFHVVGDRILHVDARLFYKHRGLEKAAEGATLESGIVFAGRACGACAVANGVAYALACEAALGLHAGAELARVRTILLELERVWSHLNDIAAACSGTGLAAGNNRFAGLTERARRLNATLTGHRFLFGTVRVGGSDVALDDEAVRTARTELALVRDAAASGWRELAFNSSFQDRLPDIGILDADDVHRLGTVGPAARAAGVAEDVRVHAPDLAYDDFVPVVTTRAVGDARLGSSRGLSSGGSRSTSSNGFSTDSLRRPQPSVAASRAGLASAASRARAARRHASSSERATASRDCICEPVRMPTGRPLRTLRPTTCSPTSR